MSKTDKTNPLYVKLAQGSLPWEEVHFHEDGICDLPSLESPDAFSKWRGCSRTWVFDGTHICCCSWCHSAAGTWDVRPGKRQRLDGKKACRDWDREY